MGSKLVKMEFRRSRVRKALKAAGKLRPRLSVFRSAKNIYAQVIDDQKGVTVAAASTLEEGFKKDGKTGADKAAASAIGKLIAERAVKAGIETVVFDRGAYLYHGRVKALADGAREGGLKF
jgi:large subunit ribosomal protein L18